MEVKDFRNYLNKFENGVIIKGIKNGIFNKTMMISAKRGKLDSTEFGLLIGTQFEYESSVAIDYYGLIKKSTGFISRLNSVDEVEAKAASALTIHFASIKDSHLVELAPELMIGFPPFKEYLIAVRGFRSSS